MSEQQQAQPQAASEAGAQHTLTGTVVSAKMTKTIAVTVERLVKHGRYSKFIRRTTKLLAHDENSECREGDVVDIAECRRLSARKAWKVVRVVKRAGAV
ncbi:MAG: 30S ribosomal protein S17 [Burkholderiales bacterium]|jgi:small subunit ribosomal protein S17|nr:30S ribosomal protein S17 [Pseudomonadota bacterium]MBK6452133.1 30S ribosomal protein S17 [Pseudomonadota bacterium]MBP6106920.1 30S ribosomal protein S17 [Steroidobacteraceae bacterium]MBP6368830.1 30S ribosomal protein S17 [Burkholderiales bacterium]MBP7013378.1 30S ribosomal protein S17 [Steroidobacteraceae bacterium]